MNLRLNAILLLATLALYGCTVAQVRDAATVGVHGKLLDAEFEAAALAVTEADELDPAERATLWQVINVLDEQRVYLRNILEKPGTEQAVAAITACARLESIGKTYGEGRETFLAALDRAGEAPPVMLVQYDASAQIAYEGLHAQVCEDGSAIQAADVAGYLGLTLRVIAATQGVPL